MSILTEIFSWWGGNTWSNRIYTRLRGRHGASRLGFGNRACAFVLLGNELCLVFRLARLIPLGTCLYLLAFVADRWWYYVMVKRH